MSRSAVNKTEASYGNDSQNLLESGRQATVGEHPVTTRYKKKVRFDKSRFSSMNHNHLQCARVFKALILTACLVEYFFTIYQERAQHFDFWKVQVYYYSLWGLFSGWISMVLSIIACNRNGWYRAAYIATEIAFAINVFVMPAFWLILWPGMIKSYKQYEKDHPDMKNQVAVQEWFEALMHTLPGACVTINIIFTDMSLESRHWWIAFLTVLPGYAVANYFGSIDPQIVNFTKHKGTIYGFEDWVQRPAYTVGLFAACATATSVVFVLVSYLLGCCKPNRWHEEEEQRKHAQQAQAREYQIKSHQME